MSSSNNPADVPIDVTEHRLEARVTSAGAGYRVSVGEYCPNLDVAAALKQRVSDALRHTQEAPTASPQFLTTGDTDNPNRGSEHSRTDGDATPDAPTPIGPANAEAVAKNVGAIRQVAERPVVRNSKLAAPEATDTQADVIALLRERAQWYREGCPHLEDGTDYARSGDLARDAGDDLVQALDIIDLLAADVVRLKAAATGDSWRTATAAEQEPLVERLAVMLFEVFDTHGPSPRRTGETDKEWGARIRRQATENIQVALREVLVVAGPSQESSPS